MGAAPARGGTCRDARVAAVESVAATLEDWRPGIDGLVDDLKLEVHRLSKHWERSVRTSALVDPGLIAAPELPAAGVPSAGWHHVDSSHREDGFGVVTTLAHLPIKGAFDFLPSLPPCARTYADHSSSCVSNSSGSSSFTGKLPKLNFPSFGGKNPKLWLSRCETYFDMYNVESTTWIPVAAMFLTDAAARWYQSVESSLKRASWSEFSKKLLDRFGRDQKELFIRQLFHIKQTSSVQEYVSRFSELVGQLTAYDHVTEDVYYAMCFVDGLRHDIRSVVAVHRPVDFDTAASLALLQEQVSDAGSYRDVKKLDPMTSSKSNAKGPHPLPAPPSASD